MENVVTSSPQIETTFKCCHTSGDVFADKNDMIKHVTNHDLDGDCAVSAVFMDEEVFNEASVINDSLTREKVPVFIEVRDVKT